MLQTCTQFGFVAMAVVGFVLLCMNDLIKIKRVPADPGEPTATPPRPARAAYLDYSFSWFECVMLLVGAGLFFGGTIGGYVTTTDPAAHNRNRMAVGFVSTPNIPDQPDVDVDFGNGTLTMSVSDQFTPTWGLINVYTGPNEDDFDSFTSHKFVHDSGAYKLEFGNQLLKGARKVHVSFGVDGGPSETYKEENEDWVAPEEPDDPA